MNWRFLALMSVFVLAASHTKAATLSPKEIADAKKLYTGKCARCHKFYDPAAYDDAEWSSWMLKMKKKSKLKPDQYELLSRYTEMLRSESKRSRKTGGEDR